MAALRFPGTAFHHGWVRKGSITGGWGGGTGSFLAASPFLMLPFEVSRVYISPNRYSQVRKVVFTVTFRHEQASGTLGTTFSARIAPSSSTTATRTLETRTVAESSHQVSDGTGQIWSANGPLDDAAFYPLAGNENQIAPRAVALAVTTSDAQTLTVEFVRGEAASTAFFADWDAAALLTTNDYVAYWCGIQRNDLNAFSTGVDLPPIIISTGVTVVQAPSPVNDCCTMFAAGNGLWTDSRMGNPSIRAYPFKYNAADWDNITSITVMIRQSPLNAGLEHGDYALQIHEITNQSSATVNIYGEAFSPGVVSADKWLSRTIDVKDLLVDGRTYTVQVFSLSGSALQNAPWSWWEITQRDCSKKVTFHAAGQGNSYLDASQIPSVPPPDRFSADQGLFDPAWYQGYPDSLILKRRLWGGMNHTNQVNNTDQSIALNADLGADIPNSLFNSIVDVVSSTPDLTNAYKVQDIDLDTVSAAADPLRLAGRRVMKMRYGLTDWAAPDELTGGCGYSYAITVPASDTLDLGPLFAISSFDPEGCSSTAAGLGDNPGVLVITNGKNVPKKFNPVEEVIQNAGIDTPFRDQEPSTSFVSVSSSPTGGLVPAIYIYRYTLRNACTGKESDPNPVDIVVDVLSASPAAEITLDFSGVVIPADSQVTQICIYRTIANGDFPVMAKVGCFEIDVISIFIDNLPDSELSEDFESGNVLSLFNAPMPCVTVVEEFRNRLFAFGDIPNLNPPGTVDVTNGSDVLQGSTDSDFDRCVLGKFIQIAGDCTNYEVIELLAPTVSATSPLTGLRLKLDREYEGTTDTELSYIICGHPNRVYISEPLEPECWPGINFLDVDPGDGDRLMGGVSNFNRLVICKRRKTYVIAFRQQPITEIVVPTLISRDIGCVAPRSFAQVASGSVWLSDRGLALYDGRGVAAVPESSVMNDLFVNTDNPNYLRRDPNGRVLGAAGVFYPKREQYLLLLPTVKTVRGASMILVWDTELRNITLLEFCQEFVSIEVANDAEGNERVYLGDSNGFVWIWDVGDTDGIGFPNATGTVRGTVTAAGLDAATGASFLEDDTASFIVGGVPGIADLSGISGFSGFDGQSNMGMAGACVFFRPADSPLGTPWKSRFIYVSTKTKLFVTPNWGNETPAVGDDYMLGPIRFEAEFKSTNYGTDDFTKRDWRQVIVHEPESVATDLRTELLRDFQNSDVDEDTVTNSAGVTGEGRNFDLGFGQGRQIRPVGRLVHNFMGVRLSNFAPEEPLEIINHLLMLSPRQSK